MIDIYKSIYKLITRKIDVNRNVLKTTALWTTHALLLQLPDYKPSCSAGTRTTTDLKRRAVKCTGNGGVVKMDGTEARTRTVVEVFVRDTVAAVERDSVPGGGGTAAGPLPQILREAGRDLTVKLTELYRDTSSRLLPDNRALKAEVGQLEAELKNNLTAALQLRGQVGRLNGDVAHLEREVRWERGR